MFLINNSLFLLIVGLFKSSSSFVSFPSSFLSRNLFISSQLSNLFIYSYLYYSFKVLCVNSVVNFLPAFICIIPPPISLVKDLLILFIISLFCSIDFLCCFSIFYFINFHSNFYSFLSSFALGSVCSSFPSVLRRRSDWLKMFLLLKYLCHKCKFLSKHCVRCMPYMLACCVLWGYVHFFILFFSVYSGCVIYINHLQIYWFSFWSA